MKKWIVSITKAGRRGNANTNSEFLSEFVRDWDLGDEQGWDLLWYQIAR